MNGWATTSEIGQQPPCAARILRAFGRRRALVVLMGLLAAGALPECRGAPTFDFGFVATSGTDVDGSERLRALGPVFERQTMDHEVSFFAIRPFYSFLDDPLLKRDIREFLWPLAEVKHLENETDWRVLLAFGHDADRYSPSAPYRVWVLPVLFTGRNAQGGSYWAVFPLGGRIDEFLLVDRFQFALFPLWSSSSKRDLKTWNVLWPLISRTQGETISKFRFFPLYGQSLKRGEYEKRFALWPLWTSMHYRDPARPGSSWVLFPLVGHVQSKRENSWLVLPPFFRFTDSDKMTRTYMPWPFVQYSSGEVDKLYLWPLWGRKTQPDESYWFALWPLVSARRVSNEKEDINRFFVAPVVSVEHRYQQRQEKRALCEEYFKVWPVVSYDRQDDQMSFSVLDLWPIKWTAPIEKNYAPFWTIYTHRRVGVQTEDEALWGLFRYRRSAEGDRRISLFPLVSWEHSHEHAPSVEWSVLKGLVGYRRDAGGRVLRLLYAFHVGD